MNDLILRDFVCRNVDEQVWQYFKVPQSEGEKDKRIQIESQLSHLVPQMECYFYEKWSAKKNDAFMMFYQAYWEILLASDELLLRTLNGKVANNWSIESKLMKRNHDKLICWFLSYLMPKRETAKELDFLQEALPKETATRQPDFSSTSQNITNCFFQMCKSKETCHFILSFLLSNTSVTDISAVYGKLFCLL